MDRIRFTLTKDGEDVRPYDFDTQRIQIGADPDRGDNLLIELPPRLRHVRAKIIRSADYVELEVITGPVWLQGSRMESGDVAELNVGDQLIFGTRKPRGVRLRFEYAREAEIVMDDVADWTASAAKRPKRAKSDEDDMMFEEEVDEYAGLNPYDKFRKWSRKQYAGFAVWRSKAARVKYWMSIVKMVVSKAGKIAAMGAGIIAIGGGYWMQIQAKLGAEESQEVAEASLDQSMLAEKQAINASHELEEQLRQCGCESSQGSDKGAISVANAVLLRFNDIDQSVQPERKYMMPDKKQRSMASIISVHMTAARNSRTTLSNTLDRVCSPTRDKDRMDLVQAQVSQYGVHEAYSFIPFVESLWCELAVSFTGPRGMMQFTRATAAEAFRKVDVTQSKIPNYDWTGHNRWLINSSRPYNGYYQMLAKCPEKVKVDYKRKFYADQPAHPEYGRRLDPSDPRTDWEWSTKAAFSWLETLDRHYKDKGFSSLNAIMLAMTAYNQGRGEVQKWIVRAMEIYGVDKEAALTYPQVYAGALDRAQKEPKEEKRRQIKEGMNYAPKVMGYYLYAADQLDARGCRQ